MVIMGGWVLLTSEVPLYPRRRRRRRSKGTIESGRERLMLVRLSLSLFPPLSLSLSLSFSLSLSLSHTHRDSVSVAHWLSGLREDRVFGESAHAALVLQDFQLKAKARIWP